MLKSLSPIDVALIKKIGGTSVSVTVDSELSDTSENPVQNKVIKSALDKLVVQSDWNQNDDTQKDYVKNRPFYTGAPLETVFVEESTVTFADTGSGFYIGQIQSIFEATVGETYKVSWDGTVYECICVVAEGLLAIGNLSIAGVGSDTGEPFLMDVSNEEVIKIYTADTSASHTFSISRIVAPVVKIDEKYLPETVMKSKYAAYIMPCISADLVKDLIYFSNVIADTTYTADCTASEWTLLTDILSHSNHMYVVYANSKLVVQFSSITENNVIIYGSGYIDGVQKINKTNLQFDETSETLTVTHYAKTT